jgi:hypothetical protein
MTWFDFDDCKTCYWWEKKRRGKVIYTCDYVPNLLRGCPLYREKEGEK